MSLTPAQIKHLQWVEAGCPKGVKQTRAGYKCRTSGFCDFLWEMGDGTEMTTTDPRYRARRDAGVELVRVVREVLTAKGRKALADLKKEPKP